jgi:hypothetical protein
MDSGGSVSEQGLRNIVSSFVGPEQEFKVGQDFYLERCGHVGKIIRVYDNGDVAVMCSKSHDKDPLKGNVYKGKFKTSSKTTETRPTTKSNLVYIIGTR